MSSEGAARIFRDFAGWTSAHGIPHIGSAQNKYLQFFWTIVFFASTSAFAWQMSELVKKFTRYDVTVETKLKFDSRPFPSVTLCNENPYLRSQANVSTALRSLVLDGGDGNDAYLTQLGIGRSMSESQRDRLSYTLEGTDYKSHLILECTFNGATCTEKQFRKRFYPQYGNCYEYNFEAKVMSTRAGPLYGLKVLALSNQEEYVPLSKSAGVRVAIHGQGEEPFPDAFSYAAAAGFVTSFGVKFQETGRLPKPYGHCVVADAEADPEEYFYGSKYSTEGCFRTCAQKIIIRDCRCGDPRYNLPPENATEKAMQDVSFCNIDVQAEKTCVNKYEAMAKLKELSKLCPCNQPCKESTFDVAVSTALWPSDVFVPKICEKIFEKSEFKPWNDQLERIDPRENTMGEKVKAKCIEWYTKNTMQFEVYYERMNYQVLSEDPAYDLVKLISDMGGQLGLWLGISFISVIEFMIFLGMLARHCLCARDDDDDSTDEDTDDEGRRPGNPFNNMQGKSIFEEPD